MKETLRYLLDTDTCIYLLNGHPQVKTHVSESGIAALAVSILTISELYFGAYNSSRVDANIQRIHDFLTPPGPEILSLSQTAAQYFGELKADLHSKGQPVGDMDLLIASIAKEYHLTVVTNNEKHFQRIPELQIANWT